jgi:protein TonB
MRMSLAPKLVVIEGGLTATEPPVVPPAGDADRLYLPAAPTRAGDFAHLVAVSLTIHAVILAGSLAWNLFGEERASGGTEELVVIEGVNVVMLDQLPSAPSPLVEAAGIETSDEAAPVEETELTAVAAADVAPPMEDASETPAAKATPPVEAPVTPDQAVASALEAEAPPLSPTDALREVAGATGPGINRKEATTATDASKDDVPPPARDDAIKPTASEKAVKPVEETKQAAVAPAAAMPKKKVEAKKKEVASAASPSAAASQATPTARGPTKTKEKAGAGGKNSKAQGKANISSYRARIFAHLRRYQSYPAAARAKRLTGRAVVRITIGSGGRLVGASLVGSSGHAILDKEVLAMARRASPYPPIPAGMSAQIVIQAPIRFGTP